MHLVKVPGDESERALYGWLGTERPGPIVEVPFGAKEDYGYVYFTTAHWLPLVNGVSSFFPPTYDGIRWSLKDLPSRHAVEYAGALGVKAIVVHTEELSPMDSRRWSEEATADGGLKKVAGFGPHVVYAVPDVSVSSSLKVETSAPSWVPAGKRFRLGLLVQAEQGRPWRHPGPQGWTPGTVQWVGSRTGRSSTVRVRFRLPPVIPAGGAVPVPVEAGIPVPDTPDVYMFQASIPALGIRSDTRVVEVRNATLSTSDSAPGLLAAAYSGAPVDTPAVVTNGEAIRLKIGATNVGAALWLASAAGDRGAVRLGWRWFKGGHEVAGLEGRAPIPYDLFPGQQSWFLVSIASPQIPGDYTLELGLVSELVAWFGSAGTPPVKLAVDVRAGSEIGFARLVEGLRLSEEGAPRLTLSTDGIRRRVGEPVELTIQARNGQRSWVGDAYLVLEGPRGALWFFDGQGLVVHDRSRWIQLRGSVALPAGTGSGGVIKAPLAGLAPGDYTWHLLFTEGGSHRIIAEAGAPMEVIP